MTDTDKITQEERERRETIMDAFLVRCLERDKENDPELYAALMAQEPVGNVERRHQVETQEALRRHRSRQRKEEPSE